MATIEKSDPYGNPMRTKVTEHLRRVHTFTRRGAVHEVRPASAHQARGTYIAPGLRTCPDCGVRLEYDARLERSREADGRPHRCPKRWAECGLDPARDGYAAYRAGVR